jgi:hypothetical protein
MSEKVERGVRLRRCRLTAIALLVLLTTPLGESSIGVAQGLHVTAGMSSPHQLVDGTHYCNGCTPPLIYLGGPVMTTNTSSGLTITPIYWAPAGTSFPAGYESILDQYVANLAAASKSATNVYSIDTEYYDTANGVKTYVTYNFKAGTPVIDTDPYPSNGCTPSGGSATCITDSQIRTELAKITKNEGLRTTLSDFYPVFFPPKVETQDRDGTNSVSAFCGYHRAFVSGSREIVYANLPYEATGCDGGQEPNGSYAADGAVSTLSHELNEAVTDPDPTGKYAWNDSTGNEIGDICSDAFGPPLGSTSSSSKSTTEYNQVINGGKYYTQEEFSDLAYKKQGVGAGCQQSESDAQHLTGASGGAVAAIFSDGYPGGLSSNGKAKSADRVVITDASGYGIAGDHVSFSEYEYSNTGQCGYLNRYAGTTGADGTITVTYTTGTSSAICSIVATEADGGRSSESFIYQGADQKFAPTASDSFPSTLEAGATSAPFKVTFKNPSDNALHATRVDVTVFPGASTSKAVKASQVSLSASTTGPNGTYSTVPLSGTTGGGQDITGYVGPEQGSTLNANGTETVYFKVNLDGDVPLSKGTPLIAFEDYLDQVNSASGSGATLADSLATNVTVATAAPATTEIWWYVVGGVLALGLVALLFARSRSRHRRTDTGPTEATSA